MFAWTAQPQENGPVFTTTMPRICQIAIIVVPVLVTAYAMLILKIFEKFGHEYFEIPPGRPRLAVFLHALSEGIYLIVLEGIAMLWFDNRLLTIFATACVAFLSKAIGGITATLERHGPNLSRTRIRMLISFCAIGVLLEHIAIILAPTPVTWKVRSSIVLAGGLLPLAFICWMVTNPAQVVQRIVNRNRR